MDVPTRSSLQLAILIKKQAAAYTCNRGADTLCQDCVMPLAKALHNSVAKKQAINFVLPAFPAKSANREKTLSALPDMGECLGLKRLQGLADALKGTYSPGAKITICSDGYVFNDVVGVTDEAVLHYKHRLSAMSRDLRLDDIRFYDLHNAFGDEEPLSILRHRLESQYADSIETLRHNVRQIPQETHLFNGLQRFLYEDLRFLAPQLSNNQLRKLAREKTYTAVQRSHAWSRLLAERFPEAIRLSIHPHACHSGKTAFRLIPGSSPWATPWHNVLVKHSAGLSLMKRFEAIAKGARLMHDLAYPYFAME